MVICRWAVRAGVLVLFLGISVQAIAKDIASCSNPKGTAYYAERGVVGPENSGWQDDFVSGGITKVSMQGDGEFDLLYVDARKEITSSREGGGHVVLLHHGKSSFALMVVYPGTTAEVYTFISSSSGKLEYLHTLSRDGGEQRVTKVSVMRGDCTYIDFEALGGGRPATQ